jgi:hypothetical protein
MRFHIDRVWYAFFFVYIFLLLSISCTNNKKDKNNQSDKVNLEGTKTSGEPTVPFFDLNKSPPKEDDELTLSQPTKKSVNRRRNEVVKTQEQKREGWRRRKRRSRANMDPNERNEKNRKWHRKLREKLLNGVSRKVFLK